MDSEVQGVFNRCRAEGVKLYMPDELLDRQLYESVAKILKNNLGKWVGGKTQAFVFDYDITDTLRKLQAGEDINTKKAFQFFPTPPEVCDFMFQLALPSRADRILEPSAGSGAIIDELIKSFWCSNGLEDIEVDTIEMNPICRAKLVEKGYNLIHDDFMTFKPKKKYDMVLANPPFNTNGSSDGYVDHLLKMNEVCSGTVTAIVPNSFDWKDSKKVREFKQLLEENDAELGIYDLKERSFASAGTGVSACIITWFAFEVKEEVEEEVQPNQMSLGL